MGKENFEFYFDFLGTNLVRMSANPYFKLSTEKIVILF